MKKGQERRGGGNVGTEGQGESWGASFPLLGIWRATRPSSDPVLVSFGSPGRPIRSLGDPLLRFPLIVS